MTTSVARLTPTLRVRECGPEDLATWDADIRQFENHHLAQTRGWIESLRDAGLGEPLFLRLEDADGLVACLPGLLVRKAGWRLFGSPLPGWQTWRMGPAYDATNADAASVIPQFITHLARRGISHFELMHTELDAPTMTRCGFRGECVVTMRAPLTPGDPDRTFAQLEPSARRNVRRAERLGLEVRFGVDDGFVSAHFRQLEAVYRRGGYRIPFSEARLRAGIEAMRAAGSLEAVSVFLPSSDVRIATGTFMREGRELMLWMWAHAEQHRWYRGTELMTWRVMERAMAAGCDTFDLMGRGDFKRKFGAVPDSSKRRWIRSDHALLTAARPVAKALHRTQQVVRGRLMRTASAIGAAGASNDSRVQPPVVLGDIDLVRALGLADLPVDLVAPPGDPARFSRHVRRVLPWHDPSRAPDALLASLLRHAAEQPEPPPLLYEDDASLLFVSRHRDRLSPLFRIVIPSSELVEQLVDKRRFQALATRLGLPVPAAEVIDPSATPVASPLVSITPPYVLKPLVRLPREWDPIAHGQKALLVESAEQLERLWPRLCRFGGPVLAQALVPGPESAIESYHVYIDASGSRRAEFTGRKLRTHPKTFGDSSALVITDAEDVRSLGRDVVERLGLRGVAKLDFKRSPDGTLALLEVNPRFTLWHHPAAIAGVNIPALVVADLLGHAAQPAVAGARAGVRWCRPWADLPAARASGVSTWQWIRWYSGCQAVRALAWKDPLPVLGAVWHRVARRTRGSKSATAAAAPTHVHEGAR